MDIKRRLFLPPSLLGIAVVPFIFLSYFGYESHQKALEKLEVIENAVFKAKKIKLLHADKERFISRYKGANHFYIEEVLEPLPLLSHEGEMLHLISHEELFSQYDLVKKREAKLAENRMKFSEGKRSEGNGIVETECSLLNKIEVDGQDLKQILSLVEGAYVGSFTPREDAPQLIIKRFSIEKKKGIALLDFEMIKRELYEKH